MVQNACPSLTKNPLFLQTMSLPLQKIFTGLESKPSLSSSSNLYTFFYKSSKKCGTKKVKNNIGYMYAEIDNNIFFNFIKRKALKNRLMDLLVAMVNHKTACIRKLSKDRAQEVAFGRLIRNKKLKMEEIKQAFYNKTSQNIKGKHILAPQDTSELNYQSMSERVRGLGTVGNGIDKGIFIHPMLAIDASDNSLIGLSALKVINRLTGKDEKYKSLPIEQKESYKWLECSQKAKETLSDAAMISHIADRESDIYEYLYRIPDKKNHIILRACRDRNIKNSKNKKLFEYVDSKDSLGSYKVKVSGSSNKTSKRTAHEAKLSVKFAKVKIIRPKDCSDKKAPKELEINAIQVKENKTTVRKGEKPVYWLILTTHEVTGFEDAKQIANWYCQRWHIEQLFRTIKKKGINIESSQIEDVESKTSMAVLGIEAAIQIMQLSMARDKTNTQCASIIFEEEEIDCLKVLQKNLEGKTEKLKNPAAIGSLRWAAWCIARLGGWKGYESQSPAGPITMADGLLKFKGIFQGWKLSKMYTD